MPTPLVSIVMAMHNAEPFVGEAIQSVLAQTFTNFELIVIDDGSRDASADRVRSFADERVRLLSLATNQGASRARNTGIAQARGSYIAVLDADDVARPDRLALQVAYMDAHPECVMSGGGAQYFGGRSEVYVPPTTHEELAAGLLVLNRFVHSSIMLRKAALDQHGLTYLSEEEPAEDYRLICELAVRGKLGCVPDILVRYRFHDTQLSVVAKRKQDRRATLTLAAYWRHMFPSHPRVGDFDRLAATIREPQGPRTLPLSELDSIFRTCERINAATRVFEPTLLRKALVTIMRKSARAKPLSMLRHLKTAVRSPFMRKAQRASR